MNTHPLYAQCPCTIGRQRIIFAKHEDLRLDYEDAMREFDLPTSIWKRLETSYRKEGEVCRQRWLVWAYLHERGWSLNQIAFATCARSHSSVHYGLRRLAGVAA
jgi:hypothetical protein